jgi:pimeloyl-ACP methyl ester carboxylesterase
MNLFSHPTRPRRLLSLSALTALSVIVGCGSSRGDLSASSASADTPAPDAGVDISTIVNLNGVDPSALPASCTTFITTTLANAGWKGGFLTVPLNWRRPFASQAINVFYYYDATRDLSTATPVMFLNGGPFSSYESAFPRALAEGMSQDVNKNHVMVWMDQRGTGCSIPNVPTATDTTDFATLTKYASDAVVYDAELVRQTLFGNRPWKILGQSYGGKLIARYLELFPENVLEAHMSGVVLTDSMTDFFYYRMKKQNEVLTEFLDYYLSQSPPVDLRPALTRIAGPDGASFCVPALPGYTAPICGRPTLDVTLANVGYGKGRGNGTTENWDSIKGQLLNLINASTDPTEANHMAYVARATSDSSFFSSATQEMVSILWAQSTYALSPNFSQDCATAEIRLMGEGVDVPNLPLSECRFLQAFLAEFSPLHFRNESLIAGNDILTQERILEMVRESGVPTFLYSGDLDSLAQTEAIERLIHSPYIHYTSYGDTAGHGGWYYEPALWSQIFN